MKRFIFSALVSEEFSRIEYGSVTVLPLSKFNIYVFVQKSHMSFVCSLFVLKFEVKHLNRSGFKCEKGKNGKILNEQKYASNLILKRKARDYYNNEILKF